MHWSLYIIIFVVSTLVGYKIINNLPSLLRTPLMSAMNALSGITILGALTITAGAVKTGHKILGALSIILAMINIAGGFGVSHRMLKMFRTEEKSSE